MKNIYDFFIIETEYDASGRYAVIVYRLTDKDQDEFNYLVIHQADYKTQVKTLQSTFKSECEQMIEIRASEHFMFIHDVIDETVIPMRHQDLSMYMANQDRHTEIKAEIKADMLRTEIRNRKSEIA